MLSYRRPVNALQVRPNELTLQRPFLERHIEATRSAYGLDHRAQEAEFPARKDAPIDFTRNAAMLDNVRLWDWRAFHDTLSQSQPLRPYAYGDTDVDRYSDRRPDAAGVAGAARTGSDAAGRCAKPLGDLAHHLHAWIRPGAGGGQSHHAGRTCRSC